MTLIAHDPEKLRELDDDTRRAWERYTERLRDLHGDEYVEVEEGSWRELQGELGRLESSRRELPGALR